ncbi:uncharacterized protein LOC127250747 isoform X7 [Andrographis paniculata]|nr:uncharacterized protein LOC127250747 isoform X7 [Andrographis paniculata]XP_051130143.1 uncharacterized protein LOC127250747 isoform X7 [Andrographis paniculata]
MSQGSNKEQRSQNIRRLARSQMLLWQAKMQEEQHEPSFSESQVGEGSDATSAENTHATTSHVGDSQADIVVGDDPRVEVRVESGGSIFWPRDASIKFRDVFKSKLVKEGSKWLSVPEDTRRWYKMKKYIKWDPAHEEKVLKKLNTSVQEAYNKWMSDIRGGRDKTAHKIIPTAVLGAWKRAWSSNDAQKRSKTAKTNRRRGNLANNLESTHTGGSRSFMETAKKLNLEKWGTYEWAHTRKQDKKSWCNMKATQVADGMKHIEEGMS